VGGLPYVNTCTLTSWTDPGVLECGGRWPWMRLRQGSSGKANTGPEGRRGSRMRSRKPYMFRGFRVRIPRGSGSRVGGW
jgi:hypothetical protein